MTADDHGGRELLDQLDAPDEVRELLESLRTAPDPRDALGLAMALRERLGEPQGYEARRVAAARRALDGWLGHRRPLPALLADPQVAIGLTFGGQAAPYIDEIAALVRQSPAADRLVRAVVDRVRHHLAELSAEDRGWFQYGFDPIRWMEDPASRPPATYLTASHVSHTMLFATQMGHLAALLEAGYDRPQFFERIRAATGHSQGVMPAILVSEQFGRSDLAEAAARFSGYLIYQGLRMQQCAAGPAIPSPELVAAAREAGAGDPTPMAAVTGLTTDEIEATLRKLGLPVWIALDNGRTRKVLSGFPADLEPVRRAFLDQVERRRKARARGQYGGALPVPGWQYLPVSVPFHCPWMEPGAHRFRDDLRRIGFSVRGEDLQLSVLDTGTAQDLRGHPDLLERLVLQHFVEPVRWGDQVAGLRAMGVDTVLDFGPSDTVFRLTVSNLKGHGVSALSLPAPEGRAAALDTRRAPRRPVPWSAMPERWTGWTGAPRVFLPGMTPTTVEAPIVVAAANAGFVAELAGGGQVTEAIFRARIEELKATLEPGRGVVLNALYLDPYLWKLQVADGLVTRLRDEGAPLIGVTVSAGVPPVDEGVALLRDLHAHGLWLNAFKPGTDGQIKQVLAIADAAPDLTFAAHVEGGKAGGHHSWEDLEDVISRNYEALRQRPNLVLAVGGGIGTPDQARRWLDGTWSTDLGLAPMPVDAVFVGTVCMAAREAATSPQVKARLVQCPGTGDWVLDGRAEGGVRSGRSHLDADIHYLDNAASRCGRLLDEIARAPETLAARREEVIEALSGTAKPWFGDLAAMSWMQVLRRYTDLCAPWIDVSHRDRLAALVRLAEGRLTDAPTTSLLQDDAELDDPSGFLERFAARWPEALGTRPHPDDIAAFLQVCRRPGKPVPFVPVLDADVRRWFKSDSLWQAHDARYDADGVLVLPGPAAVGGITTADEPVAELLARFAQAHVPRRDVRQARDVGLPGGRLGRNPVPALIAAGHEVRLHDGSVVLSAGDRELDLCLREGPHGVTWDREAFLEAQRVFWGLPQPGADPWRPSIVRTELTRERIVGFLLATGDDSRGLCDPGRTARAPLALAFPIAWEAVWKALGNVRPDVLDLVHEDQTLVAGPGWPLREGDVVDTVARVVGLHATPTGRRFVVAAELFRGRVLCAELRSAFFVRGRGTPTTTDDREPFRLSIRLDDDGSRDLLLEQPWFHPTQEVPLGVTLAVSCAHHVAQRGPGGTRHTSRGVVRCGEEVVARIELDSAETLRTHPVAAVCRLLEDHRIDRPLSRIRDLGSAEIVAPADLGNYARASGDHNPIHLLEPVARLAGHPGRIVHGMWTASAAAHRLAALAAEGDGRRLVELETRFVAPVLPGDKLVVSARHVAMRDGHRLIELDVAVDQDGERRVVLTGKARVRPPTTAYVFPGQGQQRQGMGMSAYARSAAARAVWDEADAACRENLGFSLLAVVRENPPRLVVDGEVLQHPDGVLNITRFTQVALVALGLAQVAELEDQGNLVPDAMFCGHSLGEHTSLGVFARGLPLAGLLDIVYQRGKSMDDLVERDATGRSPYRMVAVRPHHAGIDEARTRALVASIARETGRSLEVVNLNVRDRQYAVTGHVDALERLVAELDALQAHLPPDRQGKPAYVWVQGVDVPFHSSVLVPGVPWMRETLRRTWPQTVDPACVVGRYIPNLVASPFRLDRDYVEQIVALTGTTELETVLSDWETWRRAPALLARALLVELLAWQFAMPVRWIETQDVLLDELQGVEQVVEVGLAEQPILSNMALQTLALRPYARHRARVLHSEGHHDELLGPMGIRERSEPAPAAEASAPAVAAQPTPVAAPAPVTAIADAAPTAAEALMVLVALQSRNRLEQVTPTETLDELLGGNSARRNQVLADVGAEFATSVPDGAHELPLKELADQLSQRATAWKPPGRYLAAALEQALAKALGASRLDRAAVLAYLESAWNLPAGRAMAVLLRLPLWARDGSSGRGGALSSAPPKGIADRAAAERWLDGIVEAWAAETGSAVGRTGSGGGAASTAVDGTALAALEARLVGDEGRLTRAGRLLAGHDPHAGALPVPGPDPERARLEAFEREHAEEREAVAPRFDPDLHLALTSAWAWIRRDAWLGRTRETSERFRGQTALVTGASPGSIAVEVVRGLLAGGARVVVTTSGSGPERQAFYKRLYQRHASRHAELHIVPYNQASFADTDALLDWLERVGDLPWLPDLLLPFAASSEIGHLGGSGRSVVSLRVLLLGVERLVAGIAARYAAHSVRERRCHVVLPLSPNHGIFGGDGVYGEAKAALETLFARWRSESAVWGRFVTLVGARIGWVRGTGLMAGNDPVAGPLEEEAGCRTYSTTEMGEHVLALLGPETRALAAREPLRVDLSGGLDKVEDLAGHVARIRGRIEARNARLRRRAELEEQVRLALHGPTRPTVTVSPRANPKVRVPVPAESDLQSWPELDHLDLHEVVVMVGYGEVGPWGSARTRWAIERDGVLSIEAAAELAWMTGLVVPREDGTGWRDAKSGENVEDVDLIARYGERLVTHAGIRLVDPAVLHFDPAKLATHLDVHLDQDFAFPVPSRELAEQMRRADPEHTSVLPGPGEGFTVVRRRGAVVRVPRAVPFDRAVGGQVPTGWDARRYGVPGDLCEQVDRTTLFVLVATAEAFVNAGLTPEEVLSHLHPTRVGSTQSSGLGGMGKISRMYRDLPEGRERQTDVLQEGLTNVMVGYVVQSWLGSYGPMSFPVAACASAAVSVADAIDKIRGGVADLIIAGATDDYVEEVSVAFADMHACASSEDLGRKGILPARMSRPNDTRRNGFVESHGAAACVLCRASTAVELGLPVHAVVAFAGSFADGLNRSVPAPGLGLLGAVSETSDGGTSIIDLSHRRRMIADLKAKRSDLAALLGEAEADRVIRSGVRHIGHDFYKEDAGISPLRGALAVLGLTADDIGVISKHDTSTQANDLNENRLHDALQRKLGRTPGVPLAVISQKSLTGHPLGAAAGWQIDGLVQTLADGVVPPNRSLDDVDARMEPFADLVFTDEPLPLGPGRIRCGLVSSLGFGHVGALVALAHPFAFWRMLDPATRSIYEARLHPRLDRATDTLRSVLSGRTPLFVPRTRRPFAAKDGTDEQQAEEIAALTDARWRPGSA